MSEVYIPTNHVATVLMDTVCLVAMFMSYVHVLKPEDAANNTYGFHCILVEKSTIGSRMFDTMLASTKGKNPT